MTGLCVQMDHGQYPSISRNGNPFQKLDIRFDAIGACGQNLIESIKDEGMLWKLL